MYTPSSTLVPPSCTSVFLFSFSHSPPPRDLHSFPTRRSSDLAFRQLSRRAHRAGTGRHDARHPGGKHGTHRQLRPSGDRKSTRLNSSHRTISYAVFCLKKKKELIHLTGERRSASISPDELAGT